MGFSYKEEKSLFVNLKIFIGRSIVREFTKHSTDLKNDLLWTYVHT